MTPQARSPRLSRVRPARIALASFAPTDGATYSVYPQPFESPSDGDRTAGLERGRSSRVAVRLARHQRRAGRGVHRHPRQQRPRLRRLATTTTSPDPGSDPDGGAGARCSTSRSTSTHGRSTHSRPSVTNLFYWNNIVHDITYKYGFDEASGNFQVNNYGKRRTRQRRRPGRGPGRQRPQQRQFGTDVDGGRARGCRCSSGRSSAPNPITVHPPSPIAGNVLRRRWPASAEPHDHRPDQRRGRSTSDAAATRPFRPASEPLDPYLADPAGKIALIDRGSCEFSAKVAKAEVNGAIMVIVANNIAGAPTDHGRRRSRRSRSRR